MAEKQNQYKRYRKEYDAARKVRIISPEFVHMTSEKSHSFVLSEVMIQATVLITPHQMKVYCVDQCTSDQAGLIL